jgi:hypothetical protein
LVSEGAPVMPPRAPRLRPYPAERIGALAVCDFVNSARNEGPARLEPARRDVTAQRSLF